MRSLPAFKSLVDTKAEIAHAFIMVEDVESAIEDCGRAGVRVASVFSDGFADAGLFHAATTSRSVDQ